MLSLNQNDYITNDKAASNSNFLPIDYVEFKNFIFDENN